MALAGYGPDHVEDRGQRLLLMCNTLTENRKELSATAERMKMLIANVRIVNSTSLLKKSGTVGNKQTHGRCAVRTCSRRQPFFLAGRYRLVQAEQSPLTILE